MVQAISARIYNPPALPDYLKSVYDLKPIAGAPNDDEVKGIHAVLRMAHTVAHIPEIFDPHLAMNLMQHLFEVQMARYREKYPCGMFPEDMVHTPPALPSHISVALEPINGVPSDEELQGAEAAIRAYERMAIVPSMFDPKVGMELSQHLFNIQFARYMHDAPRAELGKKNNAKNNASRSVRIPPQTRQPLDTASELSEEETLEVSNEPRVGNPLATQGPSPPQIEPTTGATSLRAIVAESNDRLAKLADTMEGVKQVLIRTQQNYSQGTRSFHYSKAYHLTADLETMNDEGQFPTAQGLPLLERNMNGVSAASQLSSENLARYLLFYNLGGNLVHSEEAPTIQYDKRNEAEKRLLDYINNRIRPS